MEVFVKNGEVLNFIKGFMVDNENPLVFRINKNSSEGSIPQSVAVATEKTS